MHQSLEHDFHLCHRKVLTEINTSNVYMQNGVLLVMFSFGSIELKQRLLLASGSAVLWHKDIIHQTEYMSHYVGNNIQKIFFYFLGLRDAY